MKRKLIQVLLAVAIALGLWMYVVMVVNPEWEDTFANITVTLDNEEILRERGLMLVQEEMPEVTLRLSGNRADLIKLNSANITLRADLSRIYSAGEQSLTYVIVYPGDVPSNAFQIISQTPQQITLSVTEWKSKDVDVQVEFSGAVPEQYIAFRDKATLDYEKIAVTGPADVIDRIATAKVKIDLDGKTETISGQFDYILCDEEGNVIENKWIKTNTEKVTYTLKIQQWKDIELRLEVIDGGGLTKDDCTITTAFNTIRVSGSEKLLENLNYLVLEQIDLATVTEDMINVSYPIVMPEGITNLSEKNVVEITVDIPDLEIREFVVRNISYINAPIGMTATLDTTEKVIQVRGSTEVLNQVTPQDLMIHVDLTGASVGTTSYKAIAFVSNSQLAYHVGVVGSYDVVATVSAVS